MDDEHYRVGHASLSRKVLDGSEFPPADVLACALWVSLDVLGDRGARISTSSAEKMHTWDFGDMNAPPSVADRLQSLPSSAVPGDNSAPVAQVTWSERSATVEVESTTANAHLRAIERDEVVDLEIVDTRLGRDIDADALAGLVAQVAAEIASDPERHPTAIPLVPTELQHWLVRDLNDVTVEYPEESTIHSLVCDVASRTPDAIAIDDAHHPVTYGDLVARATAIRDLLVGAGIQPDEAVAVMFPRSANCVAAMLGVLLAGGVYVPIALEEPELRREQMLKILDVRLVLHGDSAAPMRLQVRDAEGLQIGDRADDGSCPLYVMFTSGSTGEPKAVVVPHRAVMRLLLDPLFIGFSSADGVGFASNPGFDAATWEVWGALCNGGRLVPISPQAVIRPNELEKAIEDRRITCLFLTTSLFNAHARTRPTMFGRLRVLGIGGEAADPSSCRRVLNSGSPPRSLINAYGPTETTTFASWFPITHVDANAIRLPIGGPVCNTTLHVLDRYRRLVPPGVPGELYIGGDGLAIGYLNDPELTARKFVPDPVAGPPHRLYATGDRVVRAPTGDVVFLGRFDDQLKIRGFRVEPAEIEAALREIDGVSAAVVLPKLLEGYPRLVAYVVGSRGLDARSVRSRLRDRLPEYLVPTYVVMLDELPLTRSGKLDRASLPDPRSAVPGVGGSPASDSVDDRLDGSIVDLWCEVLDLRAADPDQTFFDAGGDSLVAVRLYGAVQRRFGVVLPSGTVDESFTVGRLIDAVRESLSRAAPPMVTEMTTTEGPLVVLVPPGGGDLDRYRWLVQKLADSFHVVGLREPGHYGTEPRPRTMRDVSAVCLRALRETGFAEPLAIVGECSGGVLAHQLAYDVALDGCTPELVVLLDTPAVGSADADAHASPARREGFATMLKRRGRNAVAIGKMHTRWTWYQARRQPVPHELAHSMTMRNNARRIREAHPPFLDADILFVQAVDERGVTQTGNAPKFWLRRARTVSIVRAPGEHTGGESFLSQANAGVTADAIRCELDDKMRAEPK